MTRDDIAAELRTLESAHAEQGQAIIALRKALADYRWFQHLPIEVREEMLDIMRRHIGVAQVRSDALADYRAYASKEDDAR